MDISSLLQECESLTFSERVKHMIELGRKSKEDNATKELLATLSRGSIYEQSLALATSHGSQDISIATQLLSSNSKYIKTQAINLICILGDDVSLLAALNSVPTYLQSQTLRRIRNLSTRRKRPTVIETFLQDLSHTNKGLFKNLFILGSTSLVEKYLPAYLETFTLQNWAHLSTYHPLIAQQELYTKIKDSEERDPVLAKTVLHVFSQWLSHPSSKDLAFALLRHSLTKLSLAQFPFGYFGTSKGELLKNHPKEAVSALVENEDVLPADTFTFQVEKLWKRLPLDLFVPFFEKYPELVDAYMFEMLRPEQRLMVYEKKKEGWKDEDGVLEWDVLKALPVKERVLEARRHLKMKGFETKPEERIKYISLLPWDEAMELQRPFLRAEDADARAKALKFQIVAAKYDEKRVGEALQLAVRAKHEQGPVLKEVFEGLREIPAARFKEEHLELLGTIVRNALDSSNMPTSAMRNLSGFVARILSIHPRWAAKQIVFLVLEKATLPYSVRLSGVVPVTEVMGILQEEMAPVLESYLRKQDASQLWSLGHAFLPYIKHWPKLQNACRSMLEVPEVESYKSMLIELLTCCEQPPGFWQRIIPLLTKDNEDIAGCRDLMMRVHRHYQNFLVNYLDPPAAPPSYTAKRYELASLSNGFYRWTEQQQERFAQIILQDLSSDDTDSYNKASYTKQLGKLLFASPDHLITLASSPKPLIQEGALRALGHHDNALALPPLISALQDDRARIAIYAFRSALLSLSPTSAFELLQNIPDTKITVSKEKVRLIGSLETEEAFQYLLSISKKELHSSVKKALFRALWPWLSRSETWEIFLSAAKNSESSIAKSLTLFPTTGLTPEYQEKNLQLLKKLLLHPTAEVRLAALKRLDDTPVQDGAEILGARLKELVFSELKDESAAAMKAVLATYAARKPELIGSLYEELLQDRARLNRVHDVVTKVLSPLDEYRHLRPAAHAVLAVLKRDRLSVKRRVGFMFSALPWVELRAYLVEIVPELTADALSEAVRYLEGESGDGWKREGDDVEEVLEMLGASADERGRRLAVSLLVAEKEMGWTEERRERLVAFRGDGSVLVAEAAWDIRLPDEEVEDDGKEDDGWN